MLLSEAGQATPDGHTRGVPSAPPDDFRRFEAAGWERAAAGYDRMLAQVTGRVVDDLLDLCAVGPGTRVVDVGCGPGDLVAAAAARGAAAVGVDVAPAMVALARRRHPGLDFRVGTAEALPVAAGSMDAVVGGFLVHHLGEPEAAVAGFRRVLASGGRLALSAWDEPGRARIVGVLLDAVAAAGVPPPAGMPAGPPFFRFSPDPAFAALLAGAGFGDVSVRTVAFEHRVSGLDELWAGLLDGTVRAAALVRGLSDADRARVRAHFDRYAAQYAVGGGLAVPVSVKLAGARVTAVGELAG
jgi:SAM-dependent methyltransferase